MALHSVQEAILSAETVPWMTIASQGPYVKQVLWVGSLPMPISIFVSVVLEG